MEIDRHFYGYSWANLPKVEAKFKVTEEGTEYLEEAICDLTVDKVDKIEVLFYEGEQLLETCEIGVFLYDSNLTSDEGEFDLDTSSYLDNSEFELLISKSKPINEDELTELIKNSIYYPNDEGDTYETQEEEFDRDLEIYIKKLLFSEEEALKQRLTNALATVLPNIKAGYTIQIKIEATEDPKYKWRPQIKTEISIQKEQPS